MQGNNDNGGPEVSEAYEPKTGEMVQAAGFNSGNHRSGAFKLHLNDTTSAIVQPGGARIFVRRETIKPIEESK